MITKESIDNFITSSIRIFNVSRKPSNQEYMLMIKVIGAGIILIGLIGFFVRAIFSLAG